MTVADLKSMCGRLFKIDMLRVHLVYKFEGLETVYSLDDDLR